MVVVSSIFMFIVFFCFFGIGCFPMLYNNLLFSSSQIDRNSGRKRLVKFFNIVSCDIVFSTGYEVSLYHIRERLDEYLEWFPIISAMFSLFVLGCILDVFHDSRRLCGTCESKRLLSIQLDHNIWHTNHSRKPRTSSYLDSLHLIIWNIEQIGSKIFPLYIDNRRIRCNPYICIPIKELVHEDTIYEQEIYSKGKVWYSRLNTEYVLWVEERGNDNRKKSPKYDIFKDDKKMPMKHFLYSFIGVHILREEESIKLIHDEKWGVFDSEKQLQKMQIMLR